MKAKVKLPQLLKTMSWKITASTICLPAFGDKHSVILQLCVCFAYY